MKKMKNQELRPTKPTLWFAFIGNLICFFWYLTNFMQFGFSFDQIDFLGIFFLINLIVLVNFRKHHEEDFYGKFWMTLWVFINLLMGLMFLRQFLSTFDPFYRVNNDMFPYLLRGLFLSTGILTIITFGSLHYFKFPKWLLIIVGLVSIFWISVYAAPTVVRQMYATGSTDISSITGIPGDKMLSFSRKNPEREVQSTATYLAILSWAVFFIIGFSKKKKMYNKESQELKSVQINDNWLIKVNSSKFNIEANENGDFVLSDNNIQVIISIWNEEGESKENLHEENKAVLQGENKKNILEEFEVKEENRILYGYYLNEKDEETKKVSCVLKGYTFVDNEYIEAKFYFETENQLNNVVSMWKKIEYQINEDKIEN